jgi:hypothetical protein
MTLERVGPPLGRIAEILLENDARVDLSEIQDLREVPDAQACAEGFQDGQQSADDRSGAMAVGPMAIWTRLGPGSILGRLMRARQRASV